MMNTESIKKYRFLTVPIFMAVLMAYCYMNKPLCYDQFVSSGLVNKQGGILAFLLGYCVNWGCNVNGRVVSTFVSGVIENNLLLYKVFSVALIFLILVLAVKTLDIREKNRTMSSALFSVFFLIASQSVQTEVYFYANILYLGMVLLTELLLICAKQVMYANNSTVNTNTGLLYLFIVLFSSFWLETFSASLLVVSVCLVVWDICFTKKLNVWNVLASLISLIGLILMGHHRKDSVISVVDISGIVAKIELVIGDLFKGNSGITCLMALILILSVLFSSNVVFRSKVCKYVILIFWGYVMVTSFCCYYNNVIEALSVPYRPYNEFVAPALPNITIPFLLPVANNLMRTVVYVIFLLTILYRVIKTENKLSNLYIYGMGAVSIGTVFVTGEFYGGRIITPGILLLALACVGISNDIENKRCNTFLTTGLIIVLLLLADRYYTKHTVIKNIREYNENIISQAVEEQMMGNWNYENDVLYVKTYTNLLFCANPLEGEAHFPFYCEFYGLDERTHVQCY